MDFGAKDGWPKGARDQDSEKVIDGVEVLSADTDCIYEVMVEFVEIGVEQPVMHKFVREMESYIFSDHQEDELKYQSHRIWQIFSLEAKLDIFVHPKICGN